jgi:ectoine hydroxylase-related dioxygenase (phytanoyl-CoA dioxygenase family)
VTVHSADPLAADFARDGVVVLRGALRADEVDELRAVLDRVRAKPDRRTRLQSRRSRYDATAAVPLFGTQTWDAGEYWLHLNAHAREPAVLRIAAESSLPGSFARLFGSSAVHFYDDIVCVKEPGTPDPTEYHHDLPQLGVGEDATVGGAWCALDPCGPETGSLVYVRGSHRSWRSLPQDGGMFDLDAAGDAVADRLVSFELEPGDAVVHHHLTVHGAGPNPSRQPRRAITLRYAAPGTRFVTKASRRLDDRTQADGTPLDPTLFPLLTPTR